MPHLKDGSIAYEGERVRGTVYNNPAVVEGVIVKITSAGDVCNAVVAFIKDAEIVLDYTATGDLEPRDKGLTAILG